MTSRRMRYFESLLHMEGGVATTTKAETLLPLLSSALSEEGERDHLRATSSLMCVPEGRSVSLNLGDLLSLEDY